MPSQVPYAARCTNAAPVAGSSVVPRAVSAAAPYVVGSMAAGRGLGLAFRIVAVAFLVAALLAFLLPETRGREIAAD